MAYRYTDVNTRLVYSVARGFTGQAGKTVKFWQDSAGTVPVDVGLWSQAAPETPGASTGSNTLTVQADSMWPAMWDRDGVQDHMWIQVGTSSAPGSLYQVFCDADQRIEALVTDLGVADQRIDAVDAGVADLSGVTDPTAARANLVLAPTWPTFGSVVDTALTGTARPVTSPYGVLTLERCVRAFVTVETQTGGGAWTPVTLTNVATGAPIATANGPGSYSFSAAGATQVRATGTVSQGGNSSWTGRLWMGAADVTQRGRYSPTPATPATSAIMNLGRFGFVPHPTTADMVYAYAGNTVVRSANGGSTYSTLFTAPLTVQRVQRPANGRLLAFCDNGQVYRADTNDANFTSVHTAETPGAANSSSFGYDEYGDIIVYAEYGLNNAADQARRCYMSEDGGATWRKIFEGPQNNGTTILTWHTHDVRYDPYEDLVWVVNGDGPANANTHFRKRGTSGFGGWTKMWPDGECPSQFTTVVPLPSCVLFLSDNFHQSIWRYDRRTRGITNVTPTTELGLTVEAYRSPEPISTNPFVDRSGTVHAAYFGWIVNTANTKIVHLYGTADGLTFHQLWTSPRAPLNEGSVDTFYGVFGASAPDSQGRLLIDYRDRVLGQSPGNLIKMARPSWSVSA